MNFASLNVITPAAAYPVSLSEAKSYCAIDDDLNDDNFLLTGLIAAATERAETITWRALLTQTLEVKLNAFPCNSLQSIVLPRPKLHSVTYIQYLDTNNTLQTWPSDQYSVDAAAEPGLILPVYQAVYPTTLDYQNALTIRYIAGFGDDPENVPETIRLAIMVMVRFWYDNRGCNDTPQAAQSLLFTHKAWA